MDMSLSKLQGMVKVREAWRAAVHGVAKSWPWLTDCTITTNVKAGKCEIYRASWYVGNSERWHWSFEFKICSLETQVGFLCCSLKVKFLPPFFGKTSVFALKAFDWMRPTPIMESNLLHSKEGSVSCSVMSDSATLWMVAHQAPWSIEFCRQEYWSGRRSQDGWGLGQGDHFLSYKFIERTIEHWENFTKQLLIASGGHQAPRKATHCLRKEGKNFFSCFFFLVFRSYFLLKSSNIPLLFLNFHFHFTITLQKKKRERSPIFKLNFIYISKSFVCFCFCF